MHRQQFGELKAIVTGGSDGRGGGDGPVVVLLHGYGAPGEDLVDLGRMLHVPKAVRFVFPEAPTALDDGYGRAWWPLDLALFERRARGEVIDRSDDLPALLPRVRAQLTDFLSAMQTALGVGSEQIILGGFSQGSMLACDVALHSAARPLGLVLLSSTLIARATWQPLATRLAGLPVLQTHGTRDPLLAHSDAERLRDLLREGGAQLEFVSFDGGHELPPVALAALGKFISSLTG
jgi:phospholipase/carboxylesterase